MARGGWSSPPTSKNARSTSPAGDQRRPSRRGAASSQAATSRVTASTPPCDRAAPPPHAGSPVHGSCPGVACPGWPLAATDTTLEGGHPPGGQLCARGWVAGRTTLSAMLASSSPTATAMGTRAEMRRRFMVRRQHTQLGSEASAAGTGDRDQRPGPRVAPTRRAPQPVSPVRRSCTRVRTPRPSSSQTAYRIRARRAISGGLRPRGHGGPGSSSWKEVPRLNSSLQSALASSRAAEQEARDAARRAQTLAIVGIVIGLAGLAVAGIAMARRPRPRPEAARPPVSPEKA
jgi:hypothetical protein